MKNIHVILVLSLLLIVYSCNKKSKKEKKQVVAITQIATHPALDDVRKGIIKGLNDFGFVDGQNIEVLFKNANGDPSLSQSIVEDFARKNVDVIVPISTPSTLGAAKATSKIPIIFSGVTDPIGTGLVTNVNSPEKNISGLSDKWPFKEQIKVFLQFFPDTEKIGMLYKQGDDVSKIGVDALTELSNELGFKLILQPVSSATDIYPSAASLYKKVDVIYTGIDHMILENMEALVKASRESKKQMFGGESGSVEKGAIMALSINMNDFGIETSKLVEQVLRGVPIKDIPVATMSNGDLIINKKIAKEIDDFNFSLADSLNAKYFEL